MRYVPSIPAFWRVFIINGCWILSKAFSASMEIIIWFLFFNLLMWWITLIDLRIFNNPCIPGTKAPLQVFFFLSFYVYLCHCINSFFSSNGCTQKTTDYSYRVSRRVPLAQLFHFIVKVTEAQECEVIFSLKITQGVCHKYKIRIQISVLQVKCSVL